VKFASLVLRFLSLFHRFKRANEGALAINSGIIYGGHDVTWLMMMGGHRAPFVYFRTIHCVWTTKLSHQAGRLRHQSNLYLRDMNAYIFGGVRVAAHYCAISTRYTQMMDCTEFIIVSIAPRANKQTFVRCFLLKRSRKFVLCFLCAYVGSRQQIRLIIKYIQWKWKDLLLELLYLTHHLFGFEF